MPVATVIAIGSYKQLDSQIYQTNRFRLNSCCNTTMHFLSTAPDAFYGFVYSRLHPLK